MPVSRPSFLAAGGAALGALALPRAGSAASPRYELREIVARPNDLETPLQYFRSFLTPTPAFFVRSHFGPPVEWPPAAYALDVGAWCRSRSRYRSSSFARCRVIA